MKYVFFHREKFGSDTAWYIGAGKGRIVMRRTKLGFLRASSWVFDTCMSLVNAGIWTMRKYKT